MFFIAAITAIYLINSCINHSRFRGGILFSTGIIGVPVHEISHYLFAKLLGFKVLEVRLFQMPSHANTTMGYVSFTRSKSIVGAVFHVLVSIAPLIIGSFCLYLGAQLPHIQSLIAELLRSSLLDYPKTLYLFITQANYLQLLSLFILASITIHMLPSWVDIKGALEGSVYISLFAYAMLTIGLVYSVQLWEVIDHGLHALGLLMMIGVILASPIALFALLTKR
ncbi:hypothetical protein AB4341_05775 [Vibrio breoganii]